MTAKRRLLKTVDEVADISCAAGIGLLREEVWEDGDGNVQRYNLAFINHFMTGTDNGRVLGYDNSHGHHHRHFKGTIVAVSVTSLAKALGRDPKSVRRDVMKLMKVGMLRTREEVNPGHGRVKIVEPVAERFELKATF